MISYIVDGKLREDGERMFGYVKPKKSELLVKEYEFYRATYCGICRAMKRHTGNLSRVTLSYDSVFLALVRMLYIPAHTISAQRRRCIAHPLSSRPMLEENEALSYVARAFAILTYYKMQDDISDERPAKRIAISALSPIVNHAKCRAGEDELATFVGEKLKQITELERASHPGVDGPATLFGELLGEIFAHGIDEKDKTVPYYVGYHLGRFIYAADAAEDYERDLKSGSYNPYVLSYGGAVLTRENRDTIKCALLLECKKLESAVNLLPFGDLATVENIISNIIYLGLPERIKFLDDGDAEAPISKI